MKRKRIGLMLTAGRHWMGGIIYIQNVIRSLDTLIDAEKPEIFLFFTDTSEPFIDQIKYPYITFNKLKIPGVKLGYFLSLITRKNVFEDGVIDKYSLDGLFPLDFFPVSLGKNNSKVAAWVPDLQPKYYPEFFSFFNLMTRDIKTKSILKNADKLVLSSQSVYDQFKTHYKIRPEMKVSILRFTSIIAKNELPDFQLVKEKYKLTLPYFIVSNQFWKHKDHLTVFRAIKALQQSNLSFSVVFTGSMKDKRNDSYSIELENKLAELDIAKYTNFVGLVNREEQLSMMKNSLAVIQPSLFEGWSTVIEDAKALSCQIIASDIPTHLEQLHNGERGFIFKAKDEIELSSLMSNFITDNVVKKPVFENYDELTSQFAAKFLEVFE